MDGDNDALYFVSGVHGFTNTLIGFTKDDGIDSGGSGSGTLNYQDCWFESIFHEGNALSGTGKIANHIRTVFINCGQGLEAGYDGPTGNMFGCLATGNLVGGRFGDNYNWTYNGFLRATNSLLIYNYRDVWGMNWADWTYRTAQMDVRSNLLGTADSHWPANAVWNPATDAARLADYVYDPTGSAVGVGFALRTNVLSATAFTNAIPVRLSRFSTNVVIVGYKAESPSGVLASGVLTFQPGETLKQFSLPIPNPQSFELLSVSLVNPSQCEITGVPQLFTIGAGSTPTTTTLIPFGAAWRYLDNGVDQGTAWIPAGFDDSGWSNGAARLGFNTGTGNSGFATVLSFGPDSGNKYRTYYFRKQFEVESVGAFTNLFLEAYRDDGVAVYLNGQDLYRNNLPSGTLAYSQTATNSADNGAVIQSATLPLTALVAGTNTLAAEVHQSSAGSSDLVYDLQLTANLVPPPAVLNHARLGDQFVLYWNDPSYGLEMADDLTGPWILVAPTGPLSVEMSAPLRFFRLRQL